MTSSVEANGDVAGATRVPSVDRTDAHAVPTARSVGFAWLIRIRWVALSAQFVVAVVANVALQAPVRWVPIAICLLIGSASNVFLAVVLRSRASVEAMATIAALVLDATLLTAMLHVSGGAANPFTVFYLVQVALAAVLLDVRRATGVAAYTCLAFATLFFDGSSAGMGHGAHAGHADAMTSHLRGMWVAYTLAAIVVGYFIARVMQALEVREREVTALREHAARAEQLALVGEVAAGAAHELGSPLGSIAIAASELERHLAGELDRAALLEDAQLLRAEAERCQRILGRVSSLSAAPPAEAPTPCKAEDVCADLESELGGALWARVEAHFVSTNDGPMCIERRGVVQALAFLVRNAVEATEDAGRDTPVRITLRSEQDQLRIVVVDEGTGIGADDLAHIGEPFFSRKAPGRGLGLGVYLAKSFASRVGGTVTIESTPGKGSSFTMTVPRVMRPLRAHAGRPEVRGAP
ncbi:MAG: HAMP domain-containing sensor histidine kinase [Polyangiales bacterium]